MAKDKGGHGSAGRSGGALKAAKIEKSTKRIVDRAARLTAWDNRVNASHGKIVNKPIGVSKYAKKPRDT